MTYFIAAVLLIVVSIAVIVLCACMGSSQISQGRGE